jgi:hypothetical protein
MRTTVTIPDDLLAAARDRARSTGTTVSAVLETALRRELATPQHADRPEVPVFHGGTGPRPGVDLTSNAALAEALDGDLPLVVRH